MSKEKGLDETERVAVGGLISKLMDRHGMSIDDLSGAAGISYGLASHYRGGRVPISPERALDLIAKVAKTGDDWEDAMQVIAASEKLQGRWTLISVIEDMDTNDNLRRRGMVPIIADMTKESKSTVRTILRRWFGIG